MLKWILSLVLLSFVVIGIGLIVSGRVHLGQDFETADRSSSQLAPNPAKHPEAVIQVYAARAFNWRGLFSDHTWIAIKPAKARHYQVLQVFGWRKFGNLPVVWTQTDVPDRSWFGNKPKIILDLRGKEAEKVIPAILAAAKSYPYQKEYYLWPGPNSNTFTAYIARQVPTLGLSLPSIALGKDFLPNSGFFAPAPSGSGYQFSIYGLLGILLAKQEGLEINILGLVFGINPLRLFVDWPIVGKIGL